MVQFDTTLQKQRIKEAREKEEEHLAKMLAAYYGFDYADISKMQISADALHTIPEEKARETKVAVLKKNDKNIDIAIMAPGNDKTKVMLESLKSQGSLLKIYVVSEIGLERAWGYYHEYSPTKEKQSGVLTISAQEILNLIEQIHRIEQIKNLVAKTIHEQKEYRVTKILEIIIAGALALNASDIHAEAGKDMTRLRYRLDGILTDVLEFDRDLYRLLLSRIKLISGLKLNVQNIAQDGRFTVRMKSGEIEVRTSVLPGSYSEAAVMRLLNPKSIAIPFEELGIEPRLMAFVEEELKKPTGMILTTGPTGSGKTTTLYAFVRKIHSPEIKIITIEDPIEYLLPGLVQTQTTKIYTFAQGLRSALRQDPDVIMVGEIRDSETANIAINAALTGHKVLSTLHTNNAAGTFPRLIDLGVDAKIMSSAINITLAQRLVRKLCAVCKKQVQATPQQKKIIEAVLATIDVTDVKILDNTGFVWATGKEKCEECHEGFKGRMGIFEAIIMTESVDKIIRTSPSEKEIDQTAKSQGILNMKQDGILKVLRGDTTLGELERVIDLNIINN